MKPKLPEENSAPDRSAAFRLAKNELLPAVCPGCGAPGTRPQSLKVSAEGVGTEGEELDAHYCDICADERNTKTTRHLAWIAACFLFMLAATTAAALAFGTRALSLQIAIPIVAGGVLPEILRRWGVWGGPVDPVELRKDASGLFLLTRSRPFRRALIEHGLEEASGGDPAAEQPFRVHRTTIAFMSLGLAWLALLHSLGDAEVRVLVSGHEKAVLLVDARHFGKISPTNAEDPRAGESVRVLGGRRKLSLISESGIPLGGATRTIWPGRTYIVGQIPPGQCLFWERREYGTGAPASTLFPVGGEGPIWELREQVDSWFIQLGDSTTEQLAENEHWETRGGMRRAIRLLPCRAQTP